MALTKHQKLARGLKALFDALETYYQKTASFSNVLQFHFYEPYLIIGRPLMKELALQSMMHVHRYAMSFFSLHDELKTACITKPLIGCIITPPVYPESRILQSSSDLPPDTRWWVPWGVQTHLPSKNLRLLEEAHLEAILYCASESEMSEWIDWFENEDKAMTFTNQFFSILAQEEKQSLLKRNLAQPASSFFQIAAIDFFGKLEFQKIRKTIYGAPFAPKPETSIAQAYELVVQSLKSRKNRYLDEFKRVWRNYIHELIFENLDWTEAEKKVFLNEWIPVKPVRQAKNPAQGARWKTSLTLDRQTYASFIKYFTQKFLHDPFKNQSEGEIVILLWLMIYISQDPNLIRPVKNLLELTTGNFKDRILFLDNSEIELSCGLSNLIQEFVGESSLQRQQKLFPNLKIDKLEDIFHRASKKLLPPNSIPALPEAFLTFPHYLKHIRMIAAHRKHWQIHPLEIHHDPISRNELKRQLLAKSDPKNP